MSNTGPLLNWLMNDKSEENDRGPDLQTLREILYRTIADGRLSKSERDVLRDCIWDQPRRPDETRLTVLRRAAFDLVSEQLGKPEEKAILEWLHDIVELLIPRVSRQEGGTKNQPIVLFSPNDPCAERISGMIRQANKSLDLCVFTITDDRLTEAVLDAAKRKLRIRLITDNLKSEDLGSDIERIAAAGVPVKLDRSPFHMHHKFAIFDGVFVMTGSYNWTRNAAKENQENLVVTHDPLIVRPFSEEFERLWAELADI
jgi:phosphatidylserine/phosphatidylglycerophosphate/cardiolipin synthase-like enzyme